MCEYCDLENKEDITLHIKKPYENTYEKFDSVIDILEKARTGGHKQLTEVSPYLAMRELEEKSKKQVEDNLYALYQAISNKWLGITKADTDPFKLGTDTFINPSTGKALTKGEWSKIKEKLIKAFRHVYKDQDTLLIKSAMGLGKILKAMPTSKAVDVPLKDVTVQLKAAIKAIESDPIYNNTILFAEEHTAEYITDLSQHQYRKIHDTIMQAQINRLSPKQLETELFDKFADMNRDWRMIAETEMANNENNSQILAELAQAGDGKPSFMIGGSSGGACAWCRTKVNGKVVMLVNDPPATGDSISYDGEQYTAVWPGKSNVGRRRSDWWVAAGAQHPHCRCYWTKYEPGYKETWDKLMDAVNKAAKESEQVKILYEKTPRLSKEDKFAFAKQKS
jgi:hypothetical protein